ncbi:MAG: TetR/AcrR family transcriptional regulator [Hyphomicrobiales bacterium]|nr:TetR/AcrR family transcriptional regulator [Hyphomicrobiales bacterium]
MAQSKTASDRDRLLEAALGVAAEGGWLFISMSDVARRASVDITTCYRIFPDKASLLAGLLMRNDCSILADGPADTEQSARDRMFEILMRRFDALQADRDGNKAIIRHLPADPISLVCLAPQFRRSMAWMLETAGLPAHGIAGELQIQGLALIFLTTLRVWMTDDSTDLSRTMTALDRALKEAEGFKRRFPQIRVCNPRSSRSSPGMPDATS